MSRFRNSRLSIIIFLVLFGCHVQPSHADYLGPNRTYVVTTYETCEYGIWAKPGNCTDSSGNPSDCTIGDWECDPGDPPDDGAYYYALGTTVVERSTTHTDPEATITGFVQCASPGENGWCIVPAALALSAHEPVAGKSILLIEGRHNGEPFACQSDSCTVNAVEGMNEFSYWALSNYGDSTQTGQTTIKQDTRPPQIQVDLNGSLGDNDWFVSLPTLSIAFSDDQPGSGIAIKSSADNGTAFSDETPYRIPEGIHQIVLQLKDSAGHRAESSSTVKVDITPPMTTVHIPPAGHGGYHHGNITFSGIASDNLSGAAKVEISIGNNVIARTSVQNDGRWVTTWDSSSQADGTIHPAALITDHAGNSAVFPLPSIRLDNSPPKLWITERWNVWDSGHVYVRDERSGISAIGVSVRDDLGRFPAKEFGFDNNPLDTDFQWDRRFADGTIAPIGSYEVLLEACDMLGNCSDVTGRVHVPDQYSTPIGTAGIRYGGAVRPTATRTLTPTSLLSQTASTQTKPLFTGTPSPSATFSVSGKPSMTATIVPTNAAAFGFLRNLPITTPKATRTPRLTSTPGNYTFLGNLPKNPNPAPVPDPLPVDPNLLTGVAAVTAAASATATALFMRRKREEELRRIADESRAEAEARARAANRQRIITNLQNQERMANPEKYKNLSTDQISYDENKVAFNEGFIRAVKAGIYNLRYAIRSLDFSSSLKRFSNIRFHKIPRKQIPQSDALIKLRNQIERITDAGSFKCGQTDDKPLNDMFTYSQLNVLFSLERLMYSESGLSFLLDIYKEGGNIEVIGKDGVIGYSCGKVNGEPIRIQTFNRSEMNPEEAWHPDLDFLTGGVTNPFPTNTGWGANILLNIEAFREMDANLRMTDVIRWNEVESTLYHELQHGIDYVSLYGEKLSQLQELNQEQINTIREDFWENKHILEDFFSARYGTMIQMEARGFRREFIIAENIYDKQITDNIDGLNIEQLLKEKSYISSYTREVEHVITEHFHVNAQDINLNFKFVDNSIVVSIY